MNIIEENSQSYEVEQPHISAMLAAPLTDSSVESIDGILNYSVPFTTLSAEVPIPTNIILESVGISLTDFHILRQATVTSPAETFADMLIFAEENNTPLLSMRQVKKRLGRIIAFHHPNAHDFSMRDLCGIIINSPHDKAIISTWAALNGMMDTLQIDTQIAPHTLLPDLTPFENRTLDSFLSQSSRALTRNDFTAAKTYLQDAIRFAASEHPFTQYYAENRGLYFNRVFQHVGDIENATAEEICDSSFLYAFQHFGGNVHMIPSVFGHTFINTIKLRCIDYKRHLKIDKHEPWDNHPLLETRHSPLGNPEDTIFRINIEEMISNVPDQNQRRCLEILQLDPQTSVIDIADILGITVKEAYAVKRLAKNTICRIRNYFEANEPVKTKYKDKYIYVPEL